MYILNKDLEQLYEDYLLNNITEDKFIIKKDNLEQNIKIITEEINKLSLKTNIVDKYYNELNNILNNILNNGKSIDNEFIKKIVDRIDISIFHHENKTILQLIILWYNE